MGQTTSMPSPLPRASSNRNKTKQTFLHMLCHICQSISSHMQIMKEIEEVRLELKKKKKNCEDCFVCWNLPEYYFINNWEFLVSSNNLQLKNRIIKLRNGTLPAISVNKRCHNHQWLQSSNVSPWALRTLSKENNTFHLASIRLEPLPKVSPEEIPDLKIPHTSLQITAVHIKGMTSVSPDSCIWSSQEVLVVKNLPTNVDQDLILGWRRFPGEGNGNPPPYSCVENSLDRGAWCATVHGVTKHWTGLNTHWLGVPSIHRKVLNSLTWDIWFSLIDNNILMFRLLNLFRKTSI